MDQIFIGRQEEQGILRKALQSRDPEMVALIGRRRVGKTFLVHNVYENRIDFEISGIQDVPLREQLENFITRLNAHAKPILPFRRPSNWSEAFQMLITYFAREMRNKIALFRAITGSQKQISLTLLTAFPMMPNEHSIGLVDSALTMDVLFDVG